MRELMQGQVSLANDDADALYQQVSPAWNRAAKYVHDKGGFGPKSLRAEPVRSAIEATATVLGKAVDYGIKGLKPSEALVSRLKSDVFYFSGMKTYHSLKEAAGALLDESGKLKSWYNFSRDIAKIDKDYNRAYLQAEHQFAIGSSQMAAKWQEFEADGDRYNLQYRTAGDDHVRESHRALQGVTLPPSDPFWDEFYPPNGWRCRCTVVQVRKEKYEQSRSIDAIESGRKATSGKFEKMFRYNPGKSQTVFPPHHPYSTSKCTSCDKRISLAATQNELCRACRILRATGVDYWRVIDTKNGRVRVSSKHGKNELMDNIETATHYAEKYGRSIDLLPCIRGRTTADVFDYALGKIIEYKTLLTPKKGAVDSRLRKAGKQSDHVVLHIKTNIAEDVLTRGIVGRLNRDSRIQVLEILWNGQDRTYTRDEILTKGFKIQQDYYKQ